MTVEITVRVNDKLGRQLRGYQDRLPEILERGLHEVLSEPQAEMKDENAILELLTSSPTPEQVLAIRPSPDLQARVSELLAAAKTRQLTQSEETELDRYLLLEHWIRLAKAYAHKQAASRK